MKLLLASSGLTNSTITDALVEMVGKSPGETKVAFIPTAANAEGGNKDWVINQLVTLWRRGYSYVDIVDPAMADIDWQSRLAEADVLYLSGGNTFYLLDQARKTGFDTWLAQNIESKVYVGGSASTILMTPTIEVAGLGDADKNLPGLTDLTGLGYVDFEVIPHVPRMFNDKDSEVYAKSKEHKVYLLDDASAVRVVDGVVDVVSEGYWKLING